MRDEVPARFRQVREDERLLRHPAMLARRLALAGEHQHRLRAYRFGGLQVLEAVADARHALQLGVEPRRDLLEHAGAGLAAGARLDRGVRTEEERVDAPALAEDELHHL